MPIVYGRVTIKKITDTEQTNQAKSNCQRLCYSCHRSINDEEKMTCINPECTLVCHVICFSVYFLTNHDYLIPVEGNCPSCDVHLLWGDLVRKKKGCFKNLIKTIGYSSDYSD